MSALDFTLAAVDTDVVVAAAAVLPIIPRVVYKNVCLHFVVDLLFSLYYMYQFIALLNFPMAMGICI